MADPEAPQLRTEALEHTELLPHDALDGAEQGDLHRVRSARLRGGLEIARPPATLPTATPPTTMRAALRVRRQCRRLLLLLALQRCCRRDGCRATLVPPGRH